jgi:hypothetical protein
MAKSSVAKKDEATREVAQQAPRNAYQQFADEVKQSGIEGSLLRFTKTGDWVSGQEQEELPEGTELIMGLNTLKRGWQKWEDQKPVDARMGLVSEGFRPPSRDELGDNDETEWEEYDGEARDPWQDTMQCLLLDPKTGEVFTFVTSSKSGKTALGEVAAVYGDRMQDGEDPNAMPIIKLASSFYKHKVYGKIMIPVFELTENWVLPPERKKEASAQRGAKSAKPGKATKASPANGRTAPKALPPPRKPGGSGKGARI